MDVIQRIWKDPVGANVIAGVILLAIGAAWAALSGLSLDHPVSIQLWILVIWGVLSAVAALYIVRTATAKPAPNVKPPQSARPSKENKIVIERLTKPLKIRFIFVTAPGYGTSSGQREWEHDYLEMFRMLGPKLMAGAEEAVVKRYLDRILLDGSEGKYMSLHVLDEDFHSLKVKLKDLGLITLMPVGKDMQWELTAEANELLPKLTYRIGK
ncbi:MAG TPA: hypothetical protein VF573_01360 [Paraburkholderia sp.]|uniref:hypothetical protein n=1 Tax=Paraburkholderia sp. TaxID=1926495 RepID=UPI002ED0F087